MLLLLVLGNYSTERRMIFPEAIYDALHIQDPELECQHKIEIDNILIAGGLPSEVFDERFKCL